MKEIVTYYADGLNKYFNSPLLSEANTSLSNKKNQEQKRIGGFESSIIESNKKKIRVLSKMKKLRP